MNQSRASGPYYIQQVADVTGLSKQVIRKWEERYELVQPERLANGYRVYSEKDVNTLLKVKTLSEKGYSIKQAVVIVKEDNETIDLSIDQESILHYEELNDYVFQLLEKGTHCDELELHLVLQQAYHHLGLATFLTSVVVPFLKEVGNRWGKGEWDEYQESISSLVVRDFLVQIRRNYQCRDDASLILGACLPYERHEIPLHIILLQFMIKGWKTILIGASPAPGSIESLVRKLKPTKVLLSATTTIPFEKDPNLLKSLDEFAAKNREIDFYLGGSGSIQYTAGMTLRAIHVTDSIEDIVN
ncbi:MerR family transcriptional regulator [Domibacillus aminovorans]|uniref:MarR family transcriptional regulator n=1 Tax=Domibacillus aminovorans TaxID=29332 RepID=A0A177LE72_9BACI|nr:MerR family transcriptional regulator [Domibacillus aminovorans]OAH62871.1 MarR family transcriptional regulator [Domibacillus aminovorans]